MDPSAAAAFSFPPDADATPADRLAEQLAHQMADDWKNGRPRGADRVLAEHPDLFRPPKAAIRLVYEELCQRECLGQVVSPQELRDRFPTLHAELEILLRCHDLLLPDNRRPVMPAAGDV